MKSPAQSATAPIALPMSILLRRGAFANACSSDCNRSAPSSVAWGKLEIFAGVSSVLVRIRHLPFCTGVLRGGRSATNLPM